MTDIFISFKNTVNGEPTNDSKIAKKICGRLKSMNYNVFMMNDTLMRQGAANYKKVIDEALNDASCIIVVGSRREFLESDWVRYEWDTYLGEVLAGRKKDLIYTVRVDNMEISQLPIGLRKYQSFSESEEESLYMYVDSSLSPTAEKDIIQTFVYPAVFTRKEGTEEEYDVYMPDLDISTDGAFLEEAFVFAKAMLETYFTYIIKYNLEFNQPSPFELVKKKYPDAEVMLVEATITRDMITYFESPEE